VLRCGRQERTGLSSQHLRENVEGEFPFITLAEKPSAASDKYGLGLKAQTAKPTLSRSPLHESSACVAPQKLASIARKKPALRAGEESSLTNESTTSSRARTMPSSLANAALRDLRTRGRRPTTCRIRWTLRDGARRIFITTKAGSDSDTVLRDSAVVASITLQSASARCVRTR